MAGSKEGCPAPATSPSRRDFLALSGRGMASGWLALNLPVIASLAACAREAERTGEPFQWLSPEEGAAVQSLTERIIPSVDGMGAREAGAAHFIDFALAGPFSNGAEFFRDELSSLVESGFAALPEPEQIRTLQGMEDSPFFGFARFLTVLGTFSDPRQRFGGSLLVGGILFSALAWSSRISESATDKRYAG